MCGVTRLGWVGWGIIVRAGRHGLLLLLLLLLCLWACVRACVFVCACAGRTGASTGR